MRIFIAVAVLLAAALVGLIVHKEIGRRESAGLATGRLATAAPIATITVGERTDIDAAIPRDGYTVVEFTAEF